MEALPLSKNLMNYTYTWIKTSNLENYSPITQVYGIIFNDKNEILICRSSSSGSWQIPGGKPEKGESFQETLTREVLEEVDLEISQTNPLGVVKVQYPNNPNKSEGDLFYQSRFTAKVEKLLNQTPDPATGDIWERKFVPSNEITNYINWGEMGKEMFKDAIVVYNSSTF
jgi:8-oxo-dGTP pyrophosphatase MutT (NUDIX family)